MEVFVRQRRNLVLVSFVLLISLIYRITLQQFNVLGNVFPLAEPHRASTMLWPLWLYWLIRYFQAFTEVGLQQFLDSLSQRFNISLQNFVAAKLKRQNADVFQKAQDKMPWGQLRLTLLRSIDRYEYLFSTDVYDKKTRNTVVLDSPQSMKLKWNEVFWLRIRTGLHVTVFTTTVTEYILPFMIAGVPVLWLIIVEKHL